MADALVKKKKKVPPVEVLLTIPLTEHMLQSEGITRNVNSSSSQFLCTTHNVNIFSQYM